MYSPISSGTGGASVTFSSAGNYCPCCGRGVSNISSCPNWQRNYFQPNEEAEVQPHPTTEAPDQPLLPLRRLNQARIYYWPQARAPPTYCRGSMPRSPQRRSSSHGDLPSPSDMVGTPLAVVQTPGIGAPLEVMAQAILSISDGIDQLRRTPINDTALLLLIEHAAPLISVPGRRARRITPREISTVIEGIASLRHSYLRRE